MTDLVKLPARWRHLGDRLPTRGALVLAYKLLVNDRAKFAALLVGITFAVFLMVQMTSMFAGVLSRASSTVINIGAKVWVMDPAVKTVANSIRMPDYVLDDVRSIDGVRYAVPLYSGGGARQAARTARYQAVNVHRPRRHEPVRPARLLEGQHRGHLRRERLHRRQGRGVRQARQPRRSAPSSSSTITAA